jgi:hypothetical protein
MNWLQVASLFAKPGDPGVVARRAGMAIAGLGLAWTLLAGGIGFGLWGLVLLLSRVMPTAAAALATSAAAVVGASLALFARKRGQMKHPAMPGAERIIERYPLESVVIAAAAGFVVAQSENVRTTLMRELLRLAPQKGA